MKESMQMGKFLVVNIDAHEKEYAVKFYEILKQLYMI